MIPNEDEFIKQLSEEIQIREKSESDTDKKSGANGEIAPGKMNKKRN